MHIFRRAAFLFFAATAACGPAPAPVELPHAPSLPPGATSRSPSIDAGIVNSPHVALGIPVDQDPSDDILIDKSVFVLSYHPRRNVANWVSWRLAKEDLGTADRSNDFRADEALPLGLYRVTANDYLHSGFDRGHLCPSGDRTRSPLENSLTFVMSNMHPQRPELNRATWKKLEEYERKLVSGTDDQVFISVGGIFGSSPEAIGHGIAVPTMEYKIIVTLHRNETVRDVGPTTPVLAVMMPNEKAVSEKPWTDYIVTVDDVERASGYDFLGKVPADIQAMLESRRATVADR